MNCQVAGCDNRARYIDEDGAFVCGICPIKQKRDSIRMTDVPALLAWARMMEARAPLQSVSYSQSDAAALRAIIGRRP